MKITMKFNTVYGTTTFYNIEAYILNGIQSSSDISEELKYILYFREWFTYLCWRQDKSYKSILLHKIINCNIDQI